MPERQNKDPSFEETLTQLESIVAHLESGNLPLDDALREFENGIKLVRSGQQQLQQAEQRIQILLSENGDAKLADLPIDHNE